MEQLIPELGKIAQVLGTGGTLVLLGFLAFERMVERGYLSIGKKSGDVPPMRTGVTKEIRHNTLDALQPLMLKMDEVLGSQGKLAGHFNHETTELLTEIRDGISKLVQKHENYEVIGIKTRDCAK